MLQEISGFLRDSEIKRVFFNFISLFFLKGANYLLPFLTYPYLMRVLSVERFGLIVFSQALIMIFAVVVDFGFGLSAVKEVSLHRDNREKLEEIFNSVLVIKLLLVLLSFLILLLLVFFVPRFSINRIFYLLCFLYVPGIAIFPIYFFQGVERMKYITIIDLAGKSLYTLLVFLFVKGDTQYILVAFFYGVSALLSGICGMFVVFIVFKIKFFFPDFRSIFYYFKKTFHFFLSRVSVSLYTHANTFVVGIVMGNAMAGLYSAAEKLIFAATSLYQPFVNAIYPYMAKRRNKKFFGFIFKLIVSANTILFSLVFLFAPQIINLVYGKNLVLSFRVLKIMSLTGILMVPAVLLGYPYLAAFGDDRLANNSVIIASVIHIVLLFVFVPFFNVYGVAWLTVLSQVIVLGTRIYGVIRLNRSV